MYGHARLVTANPSRPCQYRAFLVEGGTLVWKIENGKKYKPITYNHNVHKISKTFFTAV